MRSVEIDENNRSKNGIAKEICHKGKMLVDFVVKVIRDSICKSRKQIIAVEIFRDIAKVKISSFLLVAFCRHDINFILFLFIEFLLDALNM